MSIFACFCLLVTFHRTGCAPTIPPEMPPAPNWSRPTPTDATAAARGTPPKKPVLAVRMESAGAAGAAQRRGGARAATAVREARLSQDGSALAGAVAMRFMTQDGLEMLGAACRAAGGAMRLIRRCQGGTATRGSQESFTQLITLHVKVDWPLTEVATSVSQLGSQS